MMTRKTYIATAKILNDYLKENNLETRPSFTNEFENGLVNRFITIFENDNPNFDADRFWEACFND
jgi:hypothetical protein